MEIWTISSAPTTPRSIQRLEIMRQRVQMLYRQGGNPTNHDPILAAAFEELAAAMEELRVLDEDRRQQHEGWLNDRAKLELECRRYQDLFNYAPAGYLVTNLDATIRQANAMAAELLQTTERSLVGRSLALFLPDGQRRAFRAEVARLRQAVQVREWELLLQPWKGPGFQAALRVRVIRGGTGQPVALHWLLHQVDPATPGPAEAGAPAEDDRAARQFAFIAEASVLLAVATHVETTLAHIARLAVPALADGCVIEFARPQDGAIRQVALARQPGGQKPRELGRGPTLAAARGEAPATQTQEGARYLPASSIARLTDDGELRAILDPLGPCAAIVAPLQATGQIVGALTFLFAEGRPAPGPNELALAKELARRIAIVLDRAQ